MQWEINQRSEKTGLFQYLSRQIISPNSNELSYKAFGMNK